MWRKILCCLMVLTFLVFPAGSAFSLSTRAFKMALQFELPLLDAKGGGDIKTAFSRRQILDGLLYRLLGVRLTSPGTFFEASMPVMAYLDLPKDRGSTAGQQSKTAFADDENTPPLTTKPEDPVSEIPPIDVEDLPPINSKEVLVAIYNTHTGETYRLTDGTDRLKGKQGGVVKVAAELAKVLKEKYGITVALNNTVHDAVYNRSYAEAQKTAKSLIASYPKMVLLVDLHRDGMVPRERTVVKLKGTNVARVLFVVGSDARESHPNWEKNYRLAQDMNGLMNKMYPGLSRGITVKKWRFNQQFHPGSIIIEVGGDHNSTEEAVRSARLVADVLARVVNARVKK